MSWDAATEARRWLQENGRYRAGWLVIRDDLHPLSVSLTALLERSAAAATERERARCERIARTWKAVAPVHAESWYTWTEQSAFEHGGEVTCKVIADAIAAGKGDE